MPTAISKPISIEKYLRSSYRPDQDYGDGVLEDRLWGEWSHSRVQGEVLYLLDKACKPLGMEVLPSLRIRVSATRVRNADICVLGPDWIRLIYSGLKRIVADAILLKRKPSTNN